MKRREGEQGSIALIVVFSMVAVLGVGSLVMDGGRLYVEKARLQTAVDAAALAGTWAVRDSAFVAEQTAFATALNNGAGSSGVTVTVNAAQGEVSVTALSTVSFGLARVLNFTESVVAATATAQSSSVSGMRGAAPLGVIWQDFIFGHPYDLKVGGGDGDTGNYGALALGGTGSSNYRDNLRNGYPERLRVGDLIPTEPGNMSGPTKTAIEDRIAACIHGCTFDNHINNCTRILYVPIITPTPNGRGEVSILGFASFFVEGNTGGESIRGRFIETHVQGETGSASDYGLRVVRLTR
jgi:hypothetical protein